MATDLAPGKQRIYACAGVGGLLAGRWSDVPEGDPRIGGWERAGLVSRTGPHGEEPPERLPRPCCGGQR